MILQEHQQKKQTKILTYLVSRLWLVIILIIVSFIIIAELVLLNVERKQLDYLKQIITTSIGNLLETTFNTLYTFEYPYKLLVFRMFDKIKYEADEHTDISSLKDFIKTSISELKKTATTSEIMKIDYTLFNLQGDVLFSNIQKTNSSIEVPTQILSMELRDYKIQSFESFDNPDIFIINFYMRISFDLFLKVSLSVFRKDPDRFMQSIKNMEKLDLVDKIGIYYQNLTPVSKVFEPLESKEDIEHLKNALDMDTPLYLRNGSTIKAYYPFTPPFERNRLSPKLGILVSFNASKVHHWRYIIFYSTLITLILTGVLGGSLERRLVQSVIKPLKHLEESMKDFEKGKTFKPPKVLVESPIREVQELLNCYQRMAETLTSSYEEIESMNEELKASYQELQRSQDELLKSYYEFSAQLSMIAEGYDEPTGNHIIRIGEISAFIAEKMGLEEEMVEDLRHFAPLHDIGKLLIPREILSKPGELTKEEFEMMEKHTIYGAMLIGKLKRLRIARQIALYHHEKMDGSGYPFGLKEGEIPLVAAIVALVDVYDALRSKRPYKDALPHEKTMEIILEGDERTKPHHFNTRVLETFVKYHEEINRIWEEVNRRSSILTLRMKEFYQIRRSDL